MRSCWSCCRCPFPSPLVTELWGLALAVVFSLREGLPDQSEIISLHNFLPLYEPDHRPQTGYSHVLFDAYKYVLKY